MRIAFALALTIGCGSSEVDAPARAPAPVTPAPAPLRPGPGLDLDGPIPGTPDTAPPTRRAATPLDLMADRALVKVAVPKPPLGGAVRFTFGDDRDAWVTRIPDQRQLPAVAYAHDKIYVSGGFESVNFYALNAKTGELAWATTNLEDNGPTAAVIDDDRVLFNTESCTLFALDAHTGKRAWFRYLGDPTLAQIAVIDGLVYAAHPGAGGQFLSAYQVKTGKPVWTRHVGTELLATPVIAGDSVYVSTIGGDTYRIDHRSGRLRWKKALRATTAPWVAGEELFVSRRKAGKEQQVVVSTATGAVLREHQVSSGSYANDVPTALDNVWTGENNWKAIWEFEGSRPVVDRGIRYVAMGNDIHASDATTGEMVWHRRYPGTTNRRTLGSVALAGSAIVVSSRDGKVFGLDVDTGYTLWSYDLGHRIAAEPIIAKGWLYAATVDGSVIALDVADPSLDGWHMFGGNAQKNGPTLEPRGTKPILEGAVQTAAAPLSLDGALAAAQQELDRDAAARKAAAAEEARRQAAIEAELEARRPKPFKLDEKCLNSVFCE